MLPTLWCTCFKHMHHAWGRPYAPILLHPGYLKAACPPPLSYNTKARRAKGRQLPRRMSPGCRHMHPDKCTHKQAEDAECPLMRGDS